MNTDGRGLSPVYGNGSLDAVHTPVGPEYIEAEYSEIPSRHLRDYVRIIHKHRWLAALCFFAVVGLALVWTMRTTRQYTATVRVQVARNSPIKLQLKDNVLNLDETDRVVNGGSSFLSTQVQALRSRDLAERVLGGSGLAVNGTLVDPTADHDGVLRAIGGRLPDFLRPRGFEADAAPPPTGQKDAPVTVDPRLLDRYMRYLEVQDVRGTDLIQITFTTPDPNLSAILAAAHTKAYLDSTEESQLRTDSAAVEFLEVQLEQSRAQLDRAETAWRQFAAENPNVAVNQEHDLLGKQVQELASLVIEAEAQRAAAQTQYGVVKKAKQQPLAPLFSNNPSMEKLRLALIDVQGQRATFKTRLGPNHSQMAELRRQEAELRLQLSSEIEQEISAAQARYGAAQQHEKELRAKLSKLEGTATQLRNLGARYESLKVDLDNARALHESLRRQKTETAVHSQLLASNVRVIERPEPPQTPSKPNVPINLLIGMLGGALAAGAAVFAREAFDHSVKNSDEVRGLLQLPTLAVIPNFALGRPPVRMLDAVRGARKNGNGALQKTNGNGNHNELVVLHEPWSAVAEAFRSLRTAVLFSTPSEPPKVVLVTSAMAGEGKTVTATNLATALADAGWGVLLIDADLREPGCHTTLGVENREGLSTVLAGQADVDKLIYALPAPRLAFLPAGPPPANPAEMVGSERMHETLSRLRQRYDFIVIDSPPVLPVTDGVVLARVVDGVVLVMKGQDSPRDAVRRARDVLSHAGARLVGVVVNNVDGHWGNVEFYDGYHGYRPMTEAPAEELGA